MKEVHAAVCDRRDAGDGIFVLGLRTALAREITAGHFVNVKVGEIEPFLRRPFSAAWCDGDTMELLIQTRGRGTRILAQAAPGTVLSLLGPLGTPFDLDALAAAPGVDLLAGGVGSAPLILLAAQLRARAPKLPVRLFLGARTRALLPEPDVASARVPGTMLATDDGTAGYRGAVTGLFEERLRPAHIVCACGPTGMLEAVRKLAAARGLRCFLSLEAEMACGFGVCQSCVVRLANGAYARVCDDGPVFDAAALAPLCADQ